MPGCPSTYQPSTFESNSNYRTCIRARALLTAFRLFSIFILVFNSCDPKNILLE